eukprot:6995231-Alexandrium_andersonii.AAC.1
MDDAVLVEPQLGLRPWVSMAVYEEGVRQLLGEHAIDSEKDALEGHFGVRQTLSLIHISEPTRLALI